MALQLQADAPILLGATLAGLAGIMLLANRSFNAGSMRTFNNPSATRTRNAAKNDSRDITQDAVLRDAISPDSNLDGKEASHTRATRLRDGWPAYATSAAAMIMLASLEIVLTALLQSERLDVSWSGWLLMVFGVTSAIGGIIYGMTRLHWPVLYQSYAFLALTGIMILVTTFAANIPVMVAAIGTAGAFQSGSLITRNLVLRDTLPAALQASGYSMMYAVQGVGYGVAAGICAIALDIGTPQWAVVACLMLAMTLTLICMVCELRMKR
jgi:predicted MFS family arabinose efflux permease